MNSDLSAALSKPPAADDQTSANAPAAEPPAAAAPSEASLTAEVAPTAAVTPQAELPPTGLEGEGEASPLTEKGEAPSTPVATGEGEPGIAEETADTSDATNADTVSAEAADTEPGEQDPLALTFSESPDAVFQSSLTLDISCPSPTAQIRYALGAKDVGEDGLLFSSKDKILLTETTLVAARAYENGQQGPLLFGRFEIRKPIWQELEPAEQVDPTPHKASATLSCANGWQLAAGSVRGKLHAHRALWREDSFALADIGTGNDAWSVVAVSDGAGSAPLSRVGSRAACEAAIEALRDSLGELTDLSDNQDGLVANDLPRLREALVNCGVVALEAIRVEGERRGKPLAAFAATLLVLVQRSWNGAQLCAALQVGDGSLALWDGTDLTLLGEADHGQHSSETRFLTTFGIEAELPSRIKFSIKNDLTAFAVMSDGVSDDYFPEEKRLGEVFQAVLPLVQKEGDAGEALVEWLGYEKKGSSDDRTLAIGWLATAEAEAAKLPPTEASDGERQATDGHP